MDMEKLNKSQIILLTLLVSFMTSIATGIVTVSLMQQAPPAITETVNRVVEHTVERVVQGQVASVTVPSPKTVVMKESDLIPQAVNVISPSIVRLYSSDATSSEFLGLGVVMDDTGTIIADSGSVGDAKEASIALSGGLRIHGTVAASNKTTGVVHILGATSTKDGPVLWKPAQFASGKPSLGQTIVLVSGKSAARVAHGLVSAVTPLSAENPEGTMLIETDLAKDGIISGSPIIDTDGTVVGVSTSISRSSDSSGFIPASALLPHSEAKEKTAVVQ